MPKKKAGIATPSVKYPDIKVQLLGRDGNAFLILGLVQKALKDAGVPHGEVQEYIEEATAEDYDHLLRITMRWVQVE
jgi:hypothetical protein